MDPYYLLSSGGSLTLGSIGPNATLYLNLNNGLGLSKAVGVSASSNFLTINDGIQGTIKVSDANERPVPGHGDWRTFGQLRAQQQHEPSTAASRARSRSRDRLGRPKRRKAAPTDFYVPEGTLTLTGGLSGTVNATMTALLCHWTPNNALRDSTAARPMSLSGGPFRRGQRHGPGHAKRQPHLGQCLWSLQRQHAQPGTAFPAPSRPRHRTRALPRTMPKARPRPMGFTAPAP